MENKTSFLKTDDNRVINEKYIIWVHKFSECLAVCTKSTGCNVQNKDTHTICKLNNLDSYNKLNDHFQ